MKDKLRFGLIAICFGLGLNIGHAETLMTNTYEIVSDVKNDSVPSGYCLVQGLVYEAYSNSSVNQGYVGETSQKRMTKVNNEGKYSIQLLTSDSTLFFFHPEYGEIVCWNYDFKSQHIVTINFITDQREDDIIYEVEKPVIYLYSEDSIKAELTLKPKGSLTFTYPTYTNSWNVTVENNNLSVEEKNYPYLFWEANMKNINFKGNAVGMEGYCIKTDSTIQFLEDVLSQLGLNTTEQTDFITYWGPRLMTQAYATVQFFIDDEYDNVIGELDSDPKPDSQRRVYMVFKGSDKIMNLNYLSKPKLKSFDRKGFTIVEWGGSEL